MFIFPRTSQKVIYPEDLANWMANHARNGILDVFHIPLDLRTLSDNQVTSAKDRLLTFVEEVGEYSRYLNDEVIESSSNDFRILDTALYDAGFVFDAMLREACNSNSRVSIRVLLANPNSEFSRARNTALNTDPIVRLTDSLSQICNSLAERNYCDKPDRIRKNKSLSGLQKISGLLDLINNPNQNSNNDHGPNNITCEIKLYSGPLYGPSYFFQNILLQGKYSPVRSGSANVMPWLILVNNQHVSNDMYDTYAFEFENLWDSSSASPLSPESSIIETDIYVIHNLNSQLEQCFDNSLQQSFPRLLTPEVYYSDLSNNQRIQDFTSLNASIKSAKIIVYILDNNNSLVPFEVAAGMLNGKHIAIIKYPIIQNNDQFLILLERSTRSYGVHSLNRLDDLFGEIADLCDISNTTINTSSLSVYLRGQQR